MGVGTNGSGTPAGVRGGHNGRALRHPAALKHDAAAKTVPSGRLSQYAPEDFIIPASDGHGHSERYTIKIQGGYLFAIERIVRSGLFPYRDEGDIVRHGVVFLLRHLERLEPDDVPPITRQLDSMNMAVRETDFQVEFLSTWHRVDGTIGRLQKEGAAAEATKLIASLKRKIDAMPDSYWRDKYMLRIKRYQYLLDRPAGGSLLQLMAGEVEQAPPPGWGQRGGLSGDGN